MIEADTYSDALETWLKNSKRFGPKQLEMTIANIFRIVGPYIQSLSDKEAKTNG